MGKDLRTLIHYQQKLDSLRITNKFLKEDLEKYIILTDSIEPISKDAYLKHEKARWENIEEWKLKQVPDSIKEKLEEIEQSIIFFSKNEKGNELRIANLRVEEAKLNYELSKINVEISDYILKNLVFFQNDSLVLSFTYLDSLLTNYKYYVIPDINEKIRKHEYEIVQLKFEALNNFQKRISILDFLLFSASNSSTITYGDIIPNSFFVKITLFLQAIFCIILLGLLVSKIGSKNEIKK